MHQFIVFSQLWRFLNLGDLSFDWYCIAVCVTLSENYGKHNLSYSSSFFTLLYWLMFENRSLFLLHKSDVWWIAKEGKKCRKQAEGIWNTYKYDTSMPFRTVSDLCKPYMKEIVFLIKMSGMPGHCRLPGSILIVQSERKDASNKAMLL